MVLVEDNATVYLNARHTAEENGPKPWGRVAGRSTDAGNSWQYGQANHSASPMDTAAPSPTSLLLLPEHGVLLMSLPTVGYHSVLKVFASTDQGHSWPMSTLVSSGLGC